MGGRPDEVNNPTAIRSLLNEVANEDDEVVRSWVQFGERSVEFLAAPMNVPDNVETIPLGSIEPFVLGLNIYAKLYIDTTLLHRAVRWKTIAMSCPTTNTRIDSRDLGQAPFREQENEPPLLRLSDVLRAPTNACRRGAPTYIYISTYSRIWEY